jgi:hypothetical protein
MLLAIGSLQILSASHLAWEGPFLHLINMLICNNIISFIPANLLMKHFLLAEILFVCTQKSI